MFRSGVWRKESGLPFLRLSTILWGLSLPLTNKFWAGWVLSYAFAKGRERKGTLSTIEEEYFNPRLAFSFYSHIHDCSSNMNISFINAKMGVVKVWSIYFLQQSPPLATVLGRHHWFRCLKLWHWKCLQMAWLLHCTVSLCVIQIFVLLPIRVIIFLCYRFLELYYRFAVLKP